MIVENPRTLGDRLRQRGDDLARIGYLLGSGAERSIDRVDLRWMDRRLGGEPQTPRLCRLLDEAVQIVERRPDDIYRPARPPPSTRSPRPERW